MTDSLGGIAHSNGRNNSLVSVITPSLNQGCFIGATLQSVLGQTYPNIELIVKDGGSTDETLEVLERYGDRLRYTSGKDGGQTEAINSGLAEARGEFLCYLNSDDTLEPNAIATMVEFLHRCPSADVVYGKADYIDQDGGVLKPYETFDWDFERFQGHCFICQPATMWRRTTVEKFGNFDETLHFAMDYEYWLRIACNGGVLAFCNQKLANSRLYDETKTVSGKASSFREVAIVTKRHLGATSPLWTYQHALYAVEKWPFVKLFGQSARPKVVALLAKLVTMFKAFPQLVKYVFRAHILSRVSKG